MSDTQQAAKVLFDELFWRNSTATNDGYDEISLGVIEKYLTQAEQRGEQRGMERAAVMMEEDCWGNSEGDTRGLSDDLIEHNRNQRALAQAIRAAKESMASSACLDCGGSYAACMDWRSRGKLGCCPDCRHRTAKEAG